MAVASGPTMGSIWNTTRLTETTYGWSYCLAQDPSDPDILYVGGTYREGTTYIPGLFKTEDGGEYWTESNLGLSGIIYALAVDPDDTQRIYAGSSYGLYISPDGGQSWTSSCPNHSINAILVDPLDSDLVYAGTRNGALVTTDRGVHWSLMNDGLNVLNVTSLTLTPSGLDQTLYAGTDGGGVYYAQPEESEREESDGTESPSLPSGFLLSQNYPNPFNASTHISFTLSKAAHVRLLIYNISGQQVNALLDDDLGSGRYAVAWDGRNASGQPVSSGLYVCLLCVDEHRCDCKMMLLR